MSSFALYKYIPFGLHHKSLVSKPVHACLPLRVRAFSVPHPLLSPCRSPLQIRKLHHCVHQEPYPQSRSVVHASRPLGIGLRHVGGRAVPPCRVSSRYVPWHCASELRFVEVRASVACPLPTVGHAHRDCWVPLRPRSGMPLPQPRPMPLPHTFSKSAVRSFERSLFSFQPELVRSAREDFGRSANFLYCRRCRAQTIALCAVPALCQKSAVFHRWQPRVPGS